MWAKRIVPQVNLDLDLILDLGFTYYPSSFAILSTV